MGEGPALTLALALAAAVLGAIAGSFLATLCIRWSRDEQVVRGRSACDGCGRTLGGRDLVPVFSYAASRGRCRTCGAAIDRTHLDVELCAAAIGGIALALSPSLSGAALALFGWALLPLAILDARHFWLPDRLTFALALSGLALGGLLSGTLLAHRLIGGAAGFLLLEAVRVGYARLRHREGLGAGDSKLLGAIGLWLGWIALPAVLLIAAAGGLVIALGTGSGRLSRFPFGAALAAAAWSYAAVTLASAERLL